MKNLLTYAMAVSVVAAISCRKERTCECTVTKTWTSNSGLVLNSTQTTKITKDNQKEKDFRISEKCYNTTSTQTFTDGTSVEVSACEVK